MNTLTRLIGANYIVYFTVDASQKRESITFSACGVLAEQLLDMRIGDRDKAITNIESTIGQYLRVGSSINDPFPPMVKVTSIKRAESNAIPQLRIEA